MRIVKILIYRCKEPYYRIVLLNHKTPDDFRQDVVFGEFKIFFNDMVMCLVDKS